jgi:addiction module RelE/StbE family toxin
MGIEYSPKFLRTFKKLPKDAKRLAREKIGIFQKNPFDAKLKTHKLSGPLRNYWALGINQKYRIIFSFLNSKITRFHIIGDHSIY